MAKGHALNQHESTSESSGSLSDEQFKTLVDLLTPGHELSVLMLADYKAQQLNLKEYSDNAGYSEGGTEVKEADGDLD